MIITSTLSKSAGSSPAIPSGEGAKSAFNLMEAVPASAAGSRPSVGAAWFNEARLGLFVHFGLYSIHGRGEWGMLWDKVPPQDYNRLADQFDARAFDADALVALAKRAGAGYVVFTARHHDGFCLWDTRTTDFNTVKTAARRDLVAEYVEACRRAGLRVGIYHSVMSWQWPAIHLPPAKAPAEWAAMVEETHAQVRELLTYYGRIDYLWYDGCVVPGLGDPGIRSRVWRSKELNAMARTLQPGILINDRAALPEDVTTPEQHVTPAPEGRLWEACMTIGDHWGWRPEDLNFKSPRLLVQNLIHCARHGGNFLLNIGPKADGSLPAEQVARLETVGDWMAVNGSAIRNSQRTPYTESEHVLGPATCSGRTLYFHLSEWPDGGARIAGIRQVIRSASLLTPAGPCALDIRQHSDGTAVIEGLPVDQKIDTAMVIAVEVADELPRVAPPSLLIVRETGRHAPAEASVHPVADWEMTGAQTLKFEADVSGRYDLELAVVAEEPADLEVTLNGVVLSRRLHVECGRYPMTLRLPGLSLFEGEHEIELRAVVPVDFGLYLWRLQPVWTVLDASRWLTIGPFPASFNPAESSGAQVREALDKSFAPELAAFSRDSIFTGAGGRFVGWRAHPGVTGETVNLASLSGADEPGLCFARLVITCNEARDAAILVGCDWWANLYLNGRLVETSRDPVAIAGDGARFNGWKPEPARIRLERGANVLLLKCHPGSIDNWFTFRINDAGDLGFSL